MQFTPLTTEAELKQLTEDSFRVPQIVFKHSTKCSISSMALSRVEKADDIAGAKAWLLDLIRFRPLSNAIAEQFQVHHESPQVLVIKNGDCIYDESHMGIRPSELEEAVAG
jgi:bacillithiol system protein YtxJ